MTIDSGTTPGGLVVVGGGAGGHACVAAYRESGGTGAVTLVSAEDALPYFRPDLTKALLRGEIDAESASLDAADWYAHRAIDMRLGCSVSAVDPATRTLQTSSGPLPYGSLVLATGSSASALPVPGGDHPDILSIRSLADAERVIAAVDDHEPVLVIGSGFVGCEAVSSLRSLGVDVTMVSKEQRPQQDRLSAIAGRLIEGWILDAGASVRGEVTVEEMEWIADGVVLHLSDGATVAGAHVIVASGAKPNVDLGRSAGLPTGDGIAVDATMRTAIGDVFAIGDIAFAHNVAAGRPLRVEHWGDAERMGAVAGRVAAGQHDEWAEVPGFWSEIAGKQLKYVAWGDGWDEVASRPSESGLTVWYGQQGVVVGVLTYEHDEDLDVGRQAIRAKTPLAELLR